MRWWPWRRRGDAEPSWAPPARVPDNDRVGAPVMSRYGVRLGRHRPRRPEWTCHCCDRPYPCPPGREHLRSTYGRGAELGQAAFLLLQEAVTELDGVPVTELYDRFVAWTRPADLELPAAFQALIRPPHPPRQQ